MSMGLTAALGARIAACEPSPPAALNAALRGIVDAFGCQLAGRREAVVGHLAAWLGDDGEPVLAERAALLSARRARADEAALLNASAAHALALDDVAFGCHPSAVLMPVLLALAERLRPAGAELLEAYVAGFETLAELAVREPEGWHRSGWHPTGLLGPVAAAAAAARLLRLPAETATRALGLAASLGGGVAANFGTQAKALHAGRAAAAGVKAALLARRGVTAAADALERSNGLLAVASPSRRVRLDGVLGASPAAPRLLEVGLSFKQHPVCYSLHRVVDAAIDIAGQPGFDAARVRQVDVHLGSAQAAMAPHERPATPLQARYSVEFAAASGLLARAAGHAQFEPAFLDSAPLQQMLARVRRHLRDDRSGDDGVFAASDRVVVHTDDGRTWDCGEVAHARGHARRPLDDAALRAKFLDGARRGGWIDGRPLHAALCGLAEAPDAGAVVQALLDCPADLVAVPAGGAPSAGLGNR
jgi:aconitate decarboxylase